MAGNAGTAEGRYHRPRFLAGLAGLGKKAASKLFNIHRVLAALAGLAAFLGVRFGITFPPYCLGTREPG